MKGITAFLSGVILSGVTLLTTGQAAANSDLRTQLIKFSNTDYSGEYTFRHCKTITKKPFDMAAPKRKVLIIGDSQACDFYNGIVETGKLNNYQVSMRYIPFRCQPVFGQQTIAAKDRPFCAQEARADSLKLAKEQIEQADIVIFAARWKPEAAQALPYTLKHMKLRANQRVIVLGNKNFGKIVIRKYLHLSPEKLTQQINDVPRHIRDVNTILREKLMGTQARFIDQQKVLCGGSDEKCQVFTNNQKLISYDGWHLTEPGARYAGAVLFKETMLGEL